MKNSIDVRFGQAVKKFRVHLGMSQECLAERSKLHRTYISDVERGIRNLSLQSISSLANGLGISLSRLFAEIERPGSQANRARDVSEFERGRLGGDSVVAAAKQPANDYVSRLRKLYIKIEDLDGAVETARRRGWP